LLQVMMSKRECEDREEKAIRETGEKEEEETEGESAVIPYPYPFFPLLFLILACSQSLTVIAETPRRRPAPDEV